MVRAADAAFIGKIFRGNDSRFGCVEIRFIDARIGRIAFDVSNGLVIDHASPLPIYLGIKSLIFFIITLFLLRPKPVNAQVREVGANIVDVCDVE